MTILVYDLAVQGDRRISPFCWRTKFALAHKGLPFETQPVALTDIPGLAGGGHKTVPILQDGDQVVSDSWAIADYLDKAYPEHPALFRSPEERGLCRFLEAWMFSGLIQQVSRFYLMDIYNLLVEKDRAHFRATREAMIGCSLEEAAAGREARIAEVRAIFEPVRLTLTYQGQPFLSGQRAGYADYMVGSVKHWIDEIGTVPLFEAGDPVVGYFDRVSALHVGMGRSTA
ncbi:glutathione S-transferase N-terminal domain-containing protein [Polyangium aurulentum]|uniref:glutathione S-transferase N-terminal domain-containing protein n=1 Tax=Polyangium aurulentum TaxID=2567896 RepID=UPI0010ADD1FB|nr:glutathione S-transferase N-terminal domain-containing protein [Polyangium aurulentum]UQA59109.1 glutathione S-transferase N-terminal domain-containing protein [Polyangium aurulentum]